MQKMSIEEVEAGKLVCLDEVRVNETLPAAERISTYLEQIHNPYCFLCGQTPVRVCFSAGGGRLQEKLRSFFLHMKG